MFSKKSIPIILLIVVLGTLFAFSLGKNGDPSRYEKILQEVGEMLEQGHYSPKKIDDNFSKEVFKHFLSDLDPEKNIFLQSDVKQLKSFETKIDDEIHGSPIQFFPAVNESYQKRMLEVTQLYKQILSQPFEFKSDETVVVDPEKLDFPSNENARKDYWRKLLKYLVLERYVDLQEDRTKNIGKEGYKPKTDAELEIEAREKVMKIMDRKFDRLKNKFNEDERFNMLVNTITSTMDPHTNFFPPVEKRYFDETMSGRFYGIGASLRYEDGNIKIATIVTGSPAWKSGELQVGDIITKVGQGTEEPQDLTGFETEDAVKLIRGKKGTEVKLYIKKTDGTNKVVSLIRDEIVLDEAFAKSALVNGARKIGYIYLPDFYADWERPNGARSSQDVAREILKLKEQKAEGIVIDLRNNGGGSLYDVIQIVGYFIEDGPVVQVRDREGNASVLRDRDKGILYNGPITVLVNEFSASASEIFAAAIQDYNRGIILGSSTTYGKGTVQRNIGLERTGSLNNNSSSDLGTVKLTLQKFYRVNGGSTQLRGVTPDVILPDQLEYLKYREKDNQMALKWDEIQKADYKLWKPSYDINEVKEKSKARVQGNEIFNQITTGTKYLSSLNDKVYSLNIEKYKQEQKQIRETNKQLDSLVKKVNELPVEGLPQDANKYVNDQNKQDRYTQWIKNLRKDIYLSEAVNLMQDMLAGNDIAKKN